MRQLNRVPPELPVTAMVTHSIVAPLSTHWRRATCEEFNCQAYALGWSLATAGLPAKDVELAKRSGRKFTVVQDENGVDVLDFEAGQPCFRVSEHRVRVEREELFIRRNGDWRGNPDGARATPLVFSGPDAWHDSLGTTLDACRG